MKTLLCICLTNDAEQEILSRLAKDALHKKSTKKRCQSKPRQTAQASTHAISPHAWSQHISMQAELKQGRKPSTDIIEAPSEQTSYCGAVAHHVAFVTAHDKRRKREHFL